MVAFAIYDILANDVVYCVLRMWLCLGMCMCMINFEGLMSYKYKV
jgi:hypothetical protein